MPLRKRAPTRSGLVLRSHDDFEQLARCACSTDASDERRRRAHTGPRRTFAEEAPALLAELHGAVTSGDSEAARRAAHTLKSNAATFGASGLAELCAGLEARAREGDLADGPQTLQRIDDCFAAVVTELAVLGAQLAGAWTSTGAVITSTIAGPSWEAASASARRGRRGR